MLTLQEMAVLSSASTMRSFPRSAIIQQAVAIHPQDARFDASVAGAVFNGLVERKMITRYGVEYIRSPEGQRELETSARALRAFATELAY